MPVLFTDRLHITLDVDKYLLKRDTRLVAGGSRGYAVFGVT